jgi:hypothetical protein
MVADVGPIQAGDYRGALLLIPPPEEALELVRIPISLEVIQPIETRTVDAGKIAPGQSIDVHVPIAIRGDATWMLQFTGSRIEAGEGIAILKVPDSVRIHGRDAQIVARLSASTNAAEGDYEARISLTSDALSDRTITVRFSIAAPSTPFTCRPQNIELTTPPGKLKSFQLRIENHEHHAIEFVPVSTAFRDLDGRDAGGLVTMFRERIVVRSLASTTITGQVLPPIRTGKYRATINLSTLMGDQALLNITVTVP